MKSRCLNINNSNPQIKLNNSKNQNRAELDNTKLCSKIKGNSPLSNIINLHFSRSSNIPSALLWVYLQSHFPPISCTYLLCQLSSCIRRPRRKDSPVNSGVSHTDDSCRWPSLSTRSVWSPSRTSCSILSQQCIYASLFVQPCATYHLSGGSRADMVAR